MKMLLEMCILGFCGKFSIGGRLWDYFEKLLGDVDAMTCFYDKSLSRGHLIVYPFVCRLKCGVASVCERVTRGSWLFAIS